MNTENTDKKLSLAFAPIKACAYVIFVIYFMTGVYWMYDKSLQYQKDISHETRRYYEDAREKIQKESSVLLRNIKNKEREIQSLTNKDLRDKVATAYTLTSHFYELHKNLEENETVKETIIEALRPLRWGNNTGFYFIFDEKNQKYLLHSQYPECEDASIGSEEIQRLAGQKIKEILYLKDTGYYRGFFNKVERTQEENIYFVKRFPHFNWVIGGGVGYKDIRLEIQRSIIREMQKNRFDESGRFLFFDNEGRTLVDIDENLVGRKISQLVDSNGEKYVNEISQSIAGKSKSTFFEYDSVDGGKTISRIAYVQKYEPWNWTIVSSIALDKLNDIIFHEKKQFKQSLIQGATLYFFVVLLTLAIVFLIAYYYSLKISRSLVVFSRFFSTPSASHDVISKEDLVYEEFRQISSDITNLIEQRDEHIKILTRQNFLLTTYQKMKETLFLSLEQIASFTLNQILSLHKSEAGYIVYYNSAFKRCQILASSFIYDKKINEKEKRKIVRHLCRKDGSEVLDLNEYGFFPREINIKDNVHAFFNISESEYLVVHCCNSVNDYATKDRSLLTTILEKMWLVYEQQKKQTEKREQLQILETIVQNLSTKIIVIGANNTLLFVSKVAEKAFNIQLSKEIVQDCYTHIPLLNEIRDQIKEALTEKKYLSTQCVGEGTYSYQVHISPVSLVGLNGVCLCIENNTEKVQLDRALAESEKMLSVAGIVTGIAHELGKPQYSLSKRIAYIESILNSGLSDGKRQNILCSSSCKGKSIIIDELEKIKADYTKANKLINEMLSFSHKDEFSNIRTYVDIAEVVNIALEHAFTKNRLSLNRNIQKITIKKEYKDIEMVSCNQSNLQQVFVNIISNAFYAISEKYADLAEGQINIRIYQDMRWATIEIEDNGNGLDETINKRIFEPFFTTKKDGRGLGLSVAKFIVTDQHDGHLGVYNTSKTGVCFQVQLPVKRSV